MDRYTWWAILPIVGTVLTLLALGLRGDESATRVVPWFSTGAILCFVLHVDLTIAISANP